jgi:hypothetical protein
VRILPENTFTRLLPIALGQVLGMGCGILGVRMMSHWVSPTDYGQYGLFLTATPVGMWVVHAGLIKFTSRYWGQSSARASLLHELVLAFLRKLPWLVLAVVIVAGPIDSLHFLSVTAALIFSATFLSWTNLAQAALQSARENWRDFGVSGTGSLTRTFLPPLCYVAVSSTTLSLYAGFSLHALLVAAAGTLALRRYWRNPETETVPQLTAVYDGPLFIGLAVTGWIMVGLNRWIVAGFFGPSAAGYFVLAGNIALIAASMPGAIFQQYFQPGIFAAPHSTAQERRALARKMDWIAQGYCAVALSGLTLLQYIAPWFVGSLISEKYRAALPYIMPAGFFLAALVTGSFFHSMLLAGRRERACAPVDLSTAAVLATGCFLTAAVGGEPWLCRWLLIAPLVPWLLTRPLARHYLFRPTGPVT